jgi:DNA repair exonuclease SbcCD ATPase subunit
MNQERDPFTEKLHQKEQAEEDIFFARRDRELLEQMRRARAEELHAELRRLAHTRCPDCGTELTHATHHGIRASECPLGHGMWLRTHESRAIADRERHSWIGRYVYRPRPGLVG